MNYVMYEHTHYMNLKVSKNASIDAIRTAYKYLAKKYHPDLNPDNKDASRVMKILNTSYEVLSNPYLKKSYDLKLEIDLNAEYLKAKNEQDTANDTERSNLSDYNLSLEEYQYLESKRNKCKLSLRVYLTIVAISYSPYFYTFAIEESTWTPVIISMIGIMFITATSFSFPLLILRYFLIEKIFENKFPKYRDYKRYTEVRASYYGPSPIR
jgi:hypothetical protein